MSPSEVSEPYDNPFWEKVTAGEERKKKINYQKWWST
jgi:hypothetical protein